MEGLFRNMLGPWQWALLALIPPAIIALYFLKLKRAPLEVPSTYLWQKSIEDLHVNSIWQRLRQSLLLFLQLLLLLLAILALLRPGWSGMQLTKDRYIFLVDNSASMSATDISPSRLEEAKRKVGEMIDELPSGAKAMIISFSDSASVVQEFTDNRRRLRRRLATIRATARTTSLRDALELSAGLANPGRTANEASDEAVAEAQPAELYIFTDGKFEDVSGFSLGNLTPHYMPIGEPGVQNLAVTALSTRQREEIADGRQAFGRIANFGSTPKTVTISLFWNDETINTDAKEYTIEPGKEQGVAFDLGDVDEGALRLVIESDDPLTLDNTAYAPVNPPRRTKVLLITPGNDALRWALSTQRVLRLAEVEIADPSILDSKEYQRKAATGAYDVILFDQCEPAKPDGDQPPKMPLANTVFIGRIPKVKIWQGDRPPRKIDGPQIMDTDRAHPLMQLVNMGDVAIAESYEVPLPPGGAALIDSTAGTICVIAPREGFEDLILGFDLVGQDEDGERYANTNWPLRPSFPTFWYGMITYFGGHDRIAQTASLRPGQRVRLPSVVGSDELQVISPSGQRQTVKRDSDGQFRFHGADEIGVYRVQNGDKTIGRLAVNLFNPSESDIRPRPQRAIQIGYVDVKGKTTWEGARRELWKVILLAALAVLVFEWYIYNRRVYI